MKNERDRTIAILGALQFTSIVLGAGLVTVMEVLGPGHAGGAILVGGLAVFFLLFGAAMTLACALPWINASANRPSQRPVSGEGRSPILKDDHAESDTAQGT